MIKRLILASILCTSYMSYAKDNSDPTGHYYLTNKMEIGSELLLKKDNSFQWYMSFGNQDLKANGSWSINGNIVELRTPARPKLSGSPTFTIFSDEDTKLIRYPSSNYWQVFIVVKKVGGVADIDVLLESMTHQQYKIKTNQNGIAEEYIPDGEKLARVGLRWSGDSANYKWFNIPEIQSKNNYAAFWVNDPKWAFKQAFEKMELVVKDQSLISTQDNMIYKKAKKKF